MNHMLFGVARGFGIGFVILGLALMLRLYRAEIEYGFRNEHRAAYVYYAIIMTVGFIIVGVIT